MSDYLIYLRKSRADLEAEALGGGDTLARHRHTLTELAAARGLSVRAVYEEVVSGDTIAARPQMQRLLREVEAGLWHGVLVMEIERLARGDSVDQGIVARAFKYSETLIITPFKTFDPRNEFDEEYFEFGLFMSRREYKTIRRRLHAGVQAARREGKYTAGKAPFGYQKVRLKGEKGGSLVPDPEAAPVVRDVFRWYVHDGLTIADIRRRLNRLLPPENTTSGGRGAWYDRRVSELLRNPHYAGYTTGTRRPTRKEVVGGQLKVVRTRAEHVPLYEGRHQALIPREDWLRAQNMLAQNPAPPVPRGKGQKNAFTGLILCGACGRKMQRNCFSAGQTPRQPLIFCASRAACPTVSHRYDQIETMVLGALRRWLDGYLPVVYDGSGPLVRFGQDISGHNHFIHNNSSHNNLIYNNSMLMAMRQCEKRLAELDARIKRAFELVETGVYSPALYSERKHALDAERIAVLQQVENLRAEWEKLSAADDLRRGLLPRVRHVLDCYPVAANAREQNRLLKTIVDRIVYTKTVRVTPNCPGDLVLRVYPLLPRPAAPVL